LLQKPEIVVESRVPLGVVSAVVSRAIALPDSVKFGDDFELDVRAFELRSSGIPLKLKPISMELLILLIERRGELVTREQIVERIWGKGIFLDTDNSINGAISRIRQVLRDDSEQPRFVQTVTGRGYRFLAPVETRNPSPAPIASDASMAPASERGLAQSVPVKEKSDLRFLTIVLSAAIVLATAAVAYFQWIEPRLRSHAAPARTMIAVLPFENLTGDAGQDYFSDGMTEEMITQLGRLDPEHLGVIARTSVMHYKHSQESLDQISRSLGVQYVLEGSLRRDGERVRITAQLIRVKDQTHLWAQQYDRQINDLLALQSEIAHEISDEIQIALGSPKAVSPAQTHSASPPESEAYDLYLKGLYFWNKRGSDGLQQAISYFQQATLKDPNYARAYAGLADSYALMGGYTGAPSGDFMFRARAAAHRAVELDDSLPEAHTALALVVQNYDFDWQTSEKEFKRAIEINANYATAHHWYAEHLMWQGRFEEAFRESERARQLDPLSLIIASDNGVILLYSRQYDRSIAQFRAVIDMDPNFSRAQMIRHAYVEKGMFAEALKVVEAMPPATVPVYWTELALIYGRAGRSADAQRALGKLLELRRHQSVDPMDIAIVYVCMSNKSQALLFLEQAYAQHSNGLTALKVDPVFDPLRNDPQFQDLLRRVGLSQ
jgi:TolB-like protein/DNA-binding winged helix-turn-helix (wHTH) protein/Flp pilus assembly protein TadD